MASESANETGQIPEADFAEQQTPLLVTDDAVGSDTVDAPLDPVDEADWSEQHRAVPVESDDSYPHALYQAWEV